VQAQEPQASVLEPGPQASVLLEPGPQASVLLLVLGPQV
jgi:hypothetical protein